MRRGMFIYERDHTDIFNFDPEDSNDPELLSLEWPDWTGWPKDAFIEFIKPDPYDSPYDPAKPWARMRFEDPTLLDKAQWLQWRQEDLVSRLQKRLPIMRCEAIHTKSGELGYQCKHWAKLQRNKRWLCIQCLNVNPRKRIYAGVKYQIPKTAMVVQGDTFEEFMSNALSIAMEKWNADT